MFTDYILLAVGLIWLTFATIYDFKTKEVPDWLSYSLILIGLSLRLTHYLLFNDFNFLIIGLISLAVFAVIGTSFYYLRQWGGGDAKLLMGLGITLASYPSFLLNVFSPDLKIPFMLTLLINILFFGAVYGVIYIIIIALIKRKEIRNAKISSYYNKKILIAGIILIALSFLIESKFAKLAVLIAVVLVLLVQNLFILVKFVEKVYMQRVIPIGKLTEGDWIVNDIRAHGKLIYSKKSPGITKEQISIIKKTSIKSVLVRYGIEFVPAILIGVIISLVFGNILVPEF